MDYFGLLWNVVDCCGLLGFFDCSGLLWITLDCCGL